MADALFPEGKSVGQRVKMSSQEFTVVGVFVKQGSFLGLFSFDDQVVLPLSAFKKYFAKKGTDSDVRVKVRDKEHMDEAKAELESATCAACAGCCPSRTTISPSARRNPSRATLEPIKLGIAVAGLFITGLALFVGAIGIMNITFVSVRERTREIGTRKALGARRRTILLQFLIEAVSICLLGGFAGLVFSWLLFQGVGAAFPSFPIEFSINLVLVGLVVSVATGVVSGFAPAWSASRLDPVTALRYE